MRGRRPRAVAPAAPRAVVEAFVHAVQAGDFEQARTYLADRGFRYTGPLLEADDADSFIADAARVGGILKRIDCRRVFVDGADVLVVQDILSTLSELAHTRVASWFTVEAGRIRNIEDFYDARAYASLFVDAG